MIFIGKKKKKKKGLLGQGLAQHIALEGKGRMGGEPTRCLGFEFILCTDRLELRSASP